MVKYDFYVDVYKGSSISSDEWRLFAKRAEEKLEHYKRIYAVKPLCEHAEGLAVCAMADAIAYFTAALNGDSRTVSAVSIGSVSVSYQGKNSVDLSPRGQERELLRCTQMYLEVYRGVN